MPPASLLVDISRFLGFTNPFVEAGNLEEELKRTSEISEWQKDFLEQYLVVDGGDDGSVVEETGVEEEEEVIMWRGNW